MVATHPTPCPCQSGSDYAQCCARWHQGTSAPTAEALMRSRYAAYALGLEDYLLTSWHSSTRPGTLGLATEPPVKWLGLRILRTENVTPEQAIVEFIARYKVNGKAEKLHETSRFVQENGRWFYVDGNFTDA